MVERMRRTVAIVALVAGLLGTPLLQGLAVSAQTDNGRSIMLDIFRCPPGVTVQQMVTSDCTPVTSGVDVIISSINGSLAPMTIADATLDGNTFRWTTTGSGASTDEWGFKRGTLPTGTSAFLVQGERVVPGQSGAFDYRFTTSANQPTAALDMYLLMSADAPVIEPPAQPTATSQPSAPAPESTAGPRPSPTATTAPPPQPTQDTTASQPDAPAAPPAAQDDSDVIPADTGDTFVAGDEVVVSEGPVNLRANPGTGGAVTTALAQGTTLTVVSGPVAANGFDWYQVETTSQQSGWVAVNFIRLQAGPEADFAVGEQLVVFDGPVNLRSAAGIGASIVTSLPQDTLLTVLGGPTAADSRAWYQVRTAAGASGWVAADFVELVDAPASPADGALAIGDRAVVIDGPVNVRSAAGTGNAVVAVLDDGDTMRVTNGGTAAEGYTWYQVETSSGATGWIASAFVERLGYASGDVVVVDGKSVNVRSEPGLKSTVLQAVHQGTIAVVTAGPTAADGRDWYQIDVAGVVSGWIAAEFIALSDAPPVQAPSGAYGAGDWIFVTDPPLNLRDTPGTSGQVLASLSDGDGMLVLGPASMADGYTWNQVENDGATGYVATDYVSGGFALGGVAVVADGPVNLRSTAGASGAILQSLAQGAQVTVANVNPQVIDGIYWFQVTTADSVTGWVAGRYLGPAGA